MSVQLQAFANGFPIALAHAGVALLILALAAVLQGMLSPSKDIAQIREGNPAAAVSFGGVLAGLAGPLAVALLTAANLVELGLWGVAISLAGLIAFRIVDLILHGLPERVREGEVSAAVLLVAAKLAVGMILAAAVAG